MSKLFSQFFGAALFTFTIIRTICPLILLMTWFGGCSAVPLFTKHLPGDRAFIKQFPAETTDNRLRLAIKATGMGDTRTLVIPMAPTIFWEMGGPARAAMGITDGLVRVSVGLEEARDVIADFDSALSWNG